MAILTLSAVVISVNWGVFIWAIANNRILEVQPRILYQSAGKRGPGCGVLRERLRPVQWAAVGLAAAGVAYQVVGLGVFPWVALTLAFSFGFYGLIRKTAAVDAFSGLFIETLILGPVALAYLAWLALSRAGGLRPGQLGPGCMDRRVRRDHRAAADPVRRRRQAHPPVDAGSLQYIVPTGHFVLAVFVYGEPFTSATLVTFGCIWAALAVYSFASVHGEAK